MYKTIIKRNGTKEKFQPAKITAALLRAGEATEEFDEEIAKKLTLRVISFAETILEKDPPTVEEIQNIVEEVLINSPYKKAAKAYIIYREQHARIREITTKAEVNIIDQYLEKIDWRVNENSNMSYSLQGLNNYISSEISKTYWLNKLYPIEIRDAHQKGDIHVHDLSIISVYCVGWDLHDLLSSGFKGASGKVESRPPKHLRSALGQIVNFFYTLQGEAAGAQAFSNFDTLLAPYIYQDELNYQEVKQALQEFVFNINVPTRVGFQTPFTNITMDLQPPSTYAKQPVIIGGKIQDKTYGDFQKEMDMINKAFLEVMIEGDAKGRVFSFPIPTYNIAKDFNWENKDLNILWEVTAKYGIPYFSNYVNSDMKPEDARSMCCRLRLDNRKLRKRGGGLFGANPLTGSIGVVTINMPKLGYLSRNENDFIERLDEVMDLAKESLEIKRKALERLTENNLYPYSRYYLRNIKKQFREYWKNHFSTIGLIGMNEACLNLFGQNIAAPRSRTFTKNILNHMRERLVMYQKETGNNFNLEATPGEGTSYRLAKIDTRKISDIIVANEQQKGSKDFEPFYTNSTQLPVDYTDDLFEALDLQDDIQTKYTGGTVMHLFAGERISDPRTVKKFVRKICDNYGLPYFTISPTFSVCPVHGYLQGEQKVCPKCKAETEVYSRVVGYLRPVSQWNKGKQREYENRKTYIL